MNIRIAHACRFTAPIRRLAAALLVLAIGLLPALAATPVAAADYHACDCADGAAAGCVPGNDAANGTTPQSAWRSYDRAQDAWSTLAAGDRLLLCRGGVFPVAGSTRWINRNCRAATPCTLAGYAAPGMPADAPRPRVVIAGGNALSLDDPGATILHEEGYVIRGLELACTACDGGGAGVFLFNDIDDVHLDDLLIHGFGVGVFLGSSAPCGNDPACDARNARLTLTASEIRDNHVQGFLGVGDDLVIAGNRFDGNGRGSFLEHNVYVSGVAERVYVGANELTRSSPGNGVCNATSLVVHGAIDDLRIEGNFIHEPIGAAGQGCYGIQLSPAYTYAERFLRAVIRGNTVHHVGNTAIALSSCVDCLVENNLIVHAQPFGTRGVSAPADARGPNDAAMARLVVRNNSFHTSTPGREAIRIGNEGDGHVVVANAMQLDAAGGDWACFEFAAPLSAFAAIDHNVCGYTIASGHAWVRGVGGLAAWQQASAFDLASLHAAPGYRAPAAPEHDLRAVSAAAAMVARGDSVLGAPLAFDGLPRGPLPDAGAHQWREDRVFADDFETP